MICARPDIGMVATSAASVLFTYVQSDDDAPAWTDDLTGQASIDFLALRPQAMIAKQSIHTLDAVLELGRSRQCPTERRHPESSALHQGADHVQKRPLTLGVHEVRERF